MTTITEVIIIILSYGFSVHKSVSFRSTRCLSLYDSDAP